MLTAYAVMLSHHIGGGDYNEVNLGAIVQYENYIGGAYKNSFGDLSVLAGKKLSIEDDKYEIGIIYGGVTGYDYIHTVGGVTGFVAPYASYKAGDFTPTLTLMANAAVLSLGYEF